MDINDQIELTGEKGRITLPLINLLRLTAVYLKEFINEYGQNNDNKGAKEFFDWILHEKLGVSKDRGKVLL